MTPRHGITKKAWSYGIKCIDIPDFIHHHSHFTSFLRQAYTDGTDRTNHKTTTPPPSQQHLLIKKPTRPYTLPNGAKITLLGSGPGDPSLLTLSAVQTLSNPETLVIIDRLVSNEIIEGYVKGEIRIAKKIPGCAEEAQDEIYRWMEEGLRDGRHVVRLKIGDPFVFGRGGEEVLRIRKDFGLEPKVIPGVSAAFSAPLLGSIPVTHRGISNQVVMCTGYGHNNTSPSLIQYHKEQTVIFLMAVGRLRDLCSRLISLANYPSDVPVGIVESAGCPNQRTVVGTLENIADVAEELDVKPPSTIVVGDVVNVLLEYEDFHGEEEEEEEGWIEKRGGLVHNFTRVTSSSVVQV